MTTVNINHIQQGISKNAKFKRALEVLSERVRGRQNTTFSRFERVLNGLGGEEWTPKEVTEFMKLMQEAGAGRIVYGHGSPRLMWDFHLQSVACAALGKPEPVRYDKDGKAIQAEGLRRPSTQKKHIPRLLKASTDAAPTSKPTAIESQQIVKLRKHGVEIEFDMKTMTASGYKAINDIISGIDRKT